MVHTTDCFLHALGLAGKLADSLHNPRASWGRYQRSAPKVRLPPCGGQMTALNGGAESQMHLPIDYLKRRGARLAAFSSLLVLLSAVAAYAQYNLAPRWSSDFAQAEAESKRLNRPLLIHFYADWCGPCQRMEREVLHSAELSQQLSRGFVAVKVNSDHHPELLDRFNVRTLPSDVIIDSRGRVLAISSGFQERHQYVARLASIARDLRASESSSQPPVQHEPRRPTYPAADHPPRDGIDRNAVDIGLDGFSPITLWNSRKWVKGRREFGWPHQGVMYFMSNAEELAQFQSDPARYAPQYLGCDPVILMESKRAIRGTAKFGAYFDDRLFLFVSTDTRGRFAREPAKYQQRREALRIDDIEREKIRTTDASSARP